ncbi:hypothetical protein [Flavobacterium psychrophilum]|jgi:hypothetical protein|uniref:hypothetical protein n=1 Tax=Flavobacterium psychrophilum TaxID=96345 RepID=UPI001D0933B4|nr:hypothetical protein [Flavobacterium psychrophilum]MCB6062601.1 hypothetical protein [Flavobacterium psychrophilum]
MAVSNRTIKKWLGKNVELTNTTNFLGTKGKIISIENSNTERAIFGYEIKIKLTSGLTVLAYKFEGLTIINHSN